MIAEIIREVYKDQPQKYFTELLEEPIICGNLFRSFDDFTQHLIFLMYANEGIISRSDIIESMKNSQHIDKGKELFSAALANLTSIKIISKIDQDRVKLNRSFEGNLNRFIMTEHPQKGEPFNAKSDSFFNLLLLLNQNNQILRECNIGNIDHEDTLSKSNFDFIRRPIGDKISILIKGYLKHKKTQAERKKTLKHILILSEFDEKKKYKIKAESSPLIMQLQNIHLLRRIEDNYFIISPYLHNFAFEEKKNTKLLQCSIIVETNFKVYVQMPKTQHSHNYRLVRQIMSSLIKIDHQDTQLSQLIVGEIKQPIMNILFAKNISVHDYFSFFLEFMADDLKIEKDLGKWNKIHFLGLEGPEHEMMIPNNVKQELKLWKNIMEKSNPHFYMGEDSRFNEAYHDVNDQ